MILMDIDLFFEEENLIFFDLDDEDERDKKQLQTSRLWDIKTLNELAKSGCVIAIYSSGKSDDPKHLLNLLNKKCKTEGYDQLKVSAMIMLKNSSSKQSKKTDPATLPEAGNSYQIEVYEAFTQSVDTLSTEDILSSTQQFLTNALFSFAEKKRCRLDLTIVYSSISDWKQCFKEANLYNISEELTFAKAINSLHADLMPRLKNASAEQNQSKILKLLIEALKKSCYLVIALIFPPIGLYWLYKHATRETSDQSQGAVINKPQPPDCISDIFEFSGATNNPNNHEEYSSHHNTNAS